MGEEGRGGRKGRGRQAQGQWRRMRRERRIADGEAVGLLLIYSSGRVLFYLLTLRLFFIDCFCVFL